MMGRMGTAILELLFPSRALCLGCGTLSGCREAWFCEECLRKLAAGWVGPFPDKQLLGSAAAYWYAGPAGGVVRALKYHQAFSDRKSTRLNSSHRHTSRMPSSA